MFSNLKDKLLNVGKTVFSHNETKAEHKIDENAGAEILLHYQKEWEAIHEMNEINAARADIVASDIDTIFNKIHLQKQNIVTVVDLLTKSNLAKYVEHAHIRMNALFDTCGRIEAGLENLEKLIEETELEAAKKKHEQHLRQMEEEKLLALTESMNEKLQLEMKQREQHDRKMMKERQEVFQQAFQNDLDLFKSLGAIPRVQLKKTQQSALLEEIQLDYDPKELEEFFEEKS